jgi:hypothetical protein
VRYQTLFGCVMNGTLDTEARFVRLLHHKTFQLPQTADTAMLHFVFLSDSAFTTFKETADFNFHILHQLELQVCMR